MQYKPVIVAFFGVMFVVLGIVSAIPDLNVRSITWINRWHGVKTEITPETIHRGVVTGVIYLILGLVMLGAVGLGVV